MAERSKTVRTSRFFSESVIPGAKNLGAITDENREKWHGHLIDSFGKLKESTVSLQDVGAYVAQQIANFKRTIKSAAKEGKTPSDKVPVYLAKLEALQLKAKLPMPETGGNGAVSVDEIESIEL